MDDSIIRNLLFRQAEAPVRVDTGEQYDCSQAQIDEFLEHNNQNKVAARSLGQATRELSIFLRKPPTKRNRIVAQRLKDARHRIRWGPDIMGKVLSDLDALYFDNCLHGNVIFHWIHDEALQCTEDGKHHSALGRTDSYGGGRCMVYLNIEMILNTLMIEGTHALMWETMLHELVHAYEIVTAAEFTTELSNYDGFIYFEKNHGFHFRWLINLVEIRAKKYLGMGLISNWEDYHLNMTDERDKMVEDAINFRLGWPASAKTGGPVKPEALEDRKSNLILQTPPVCLPVKKEPKGHSSRRTKKITSTKRHGLIRLPSKRSDSSTDVSSVKTEDTGIKPEALDNIRHDSDVKSDDSDIIAEDSDIKLEDADSP